MKTVIPGLTEECPSRTEPRPGSRRLRSRIVPLVPLLAAGFLGGAPLSQAQLLTDLFVVKDAVSRNHMEYHQVSLAKGQEAALADLKGPGKVTYFYITDDTQVRWFPGLVL